MTLLAISQGKKPLKLRMLQEEKRECDDGFEMGEPCGNYLPLTYEWAERGNL